MEKKPRKKPTVSTKPTIFSGETKFTSKSKKEILKLEVQKTTAISVLFGLLNKYYLKFSKGPLLTI